MSHLRRALVLLADQDRRRWDRAMIAEAAALPKRGESAPVLIFSLEMSSQELAERILSSTALIESSRLKSGSLSDADWTKAHQTFRELSMQRMRWDITILRLIN